MDEVTGNSHAELLDDGSIEFTFAYHTATRPYSILKATRDTSSKPGFCGASLGQSVNDRGIGTPYFRVKRTPVWGL